MRVENGKRLALALLLSVLLGAGPAFGFCRTTTCNDATSSDECQFDDTGCAITGAPLQWPESSIDFKVYPDGSALRSIEAELARELTELAFAEWTGVDCDGAPPSIAVSDVSVLTRAEEQALAEQLENDDDRAKIGVRTLAFYDEGWPHPGGSHSIALTTITFGVDSGNIYGVEVEINAESHNLTVSDEAPEVDLLSVVTHELGHVFGLADLTAPGPTMFGAYAGDGDLGPRSLSSDDAAGMCAIYPPGRHPEEASGCSCRTAPRPPTSSAPALGSLVLLLLIARLSGRGARLRRRSA